MLPITLSPDTAYATKSNIRHPGSSADATAAASRADDRIEEVLDTVGADVANLTVTEVAA
jgi:hypothetical protein